MRRGILPQQFDGLRRAAQANQRLGKIDPRCVSPTAVGGGLQRHPTEIIDRGGVFALGEGEHAQPIGRILLHLFEEPLPGLGLFGGCSLEGSGDRLFARPGRQVAHLCPLGAIEVATEFPQTGSIERPHEACAPSPPHGIAPRRLRHSHRHRCEFPTDSRLHASPVALSLGQNFPGKLPETDPRFARRLFPRRLRIRPAILRLGSGQGPTGTGSKRLGIEGELHAPRAHELFIDDPHPPRQIPRIGRHEHRQPGNVTRLHRIDAIGKREPLEDGGVGGRLPGRSDADSIRPRDRHAIGRLEEPCFAFGDDRRNPGANTTPVRITGGEHHAVESGMPEQFEKDPGPLRRAGPSREQNLARQKPAGGRRAFRRHHRRVADKGQRSDCPPEEIDGDVEILDGVAGGTGGDIGQPPLIPQRRDVLLRIEHRTAQRLGRGTDP